MTVIEAEDWHDFKKYVGQVAAVSNSEDWRFAFRGLSDATWPIRATLDRSRAFATTSERSHYENRLQAAFRSEMLSYVVPGADVPEGPALALLARHHGLPSSWLDWSTSPYVSAYFAFSSAVASTEHVAIWSLDRNSLPRSFASDDLIDDPMLLRFNTRAIRQRGIFIRVADANTDLENVLGDALTKITIPTTEIKVALTDLSYMTINASSLFNDLDGAARAANVRMLHGF